MEASSPPKLFHRTGRGRIYHGDALEVLGRHIEPQSVDLIMTSPPFGLVRKKDYGNVDADEVLPGDSRPSGNFITASRSSMDRGFLT
jgi:DNA modification methylase